LATKEILCIVMFLTVCGSLMLGFPVAFSLAGTALIFAVIANVFFGIDLSSFVSAFPQRILQIEQNEVLVAVPLFVFMGVMLERSKVAEELLVNMGRAFGEIRGGLAISVCVVGAMLAASTGVVGATVVTMGLLSLPTMLRRNYNKELACGTIAASGTLGQLIPPSIVLILLGDQLAVAYQAAQLKLGKFSPDTVSVNDLFAGSLLPGLVLVVGYIAYIAILTLIRPSLGPPIPPEVEGDLTKRWGGKGVISAIMIGIVAVFAAGANLGALPVWYAILAVAAGIGLLLAYRLDTKRILPVVVGVVGLVGIYALSEVYYRKFSGGFFIVYILCIAALGYGMFAVPWRDAFWGAILRSLIPPLLLIVAVLGSILGGLASPTEAAAVGSVGAIMLAGYRLDPARGWPILAGGVALVLILILTAIFDLRMQRTQIATSEWIAIGGAFVLAAVLIWGIVVALLRTLSYRIAGGSEVEPDRKLAARWPVYLLFLAALVGAMVLVVFRSLTPLGFLTLAALVAAGLTAVVEIRRRRINRKSVLTEVVRQTADITSMVFIILAGAAMFSLVFRGLGGDDLIEHWLKGMPGGALGAVIIVMLAMFVMGFFLDFLEIIFIIVPVVSPVLLQLEFKGEAMSPVWLGVLMAMNLQTSFLTPPFGFALFYLRGVAPAEVTTGHIYRGIVPFVLMQLLGLVVLWFAPGLATWLPKSIFGK
jgi:tripartite ATP-independent transporter DctM subunit